jgi:DNA-binding transcriptional ArsR family regulator
LVRFAAVITIFRQASTPFAPPVRELAADFSISRPAVSQHLRILEKAALVSEERVGRERRYGLHAHDRIELTSAANQEMVQAVVSDGAHETLGERVRPRGTSRGLDRSPL